MLSDQYTIYFAVILFLLGIWFAGRSKKISFTAIFFMILAGYLLFQSFPVTVPVIMKQTEQLIIVTALKKPGKIIIPI